MAGVTVRPGYWCDVVALPDGRVGQVTVDGSLVRCFLEDTLAWTEHAPDALGFCRAAVHQDLVLSIHQGQSGRAWLIGFGLVRDLGPTFGVQPVAIDAQFAYVVRSSQAYDRIDLESGAVETLPHGAPGSSQGISDIAEDGSIWWADLHRTLDGLTYPNRRGAVTVGQADPPQIALHMNGEQFTVFDGDGFEPHVAQAGGRYAVCARTGHGAAYAVGPPWPRAVPVPPPTPIPSPIPEPIPVSIPNQLATVQRVRAKYPTPLGAQHAAFLIDVAQQTGTKLLHKEAGTNILLPTGVRVSQDILMVADQGIDILSDGEGAAVPTWQEKGQIAGEYIDVSDIGVEPKPEPAPQPQPKPTGVDLAAILSRLDLMEQRSTTANAETVAAVLRLAAAVEALRVPKERTVVFPSYTGTVKLTGAVRLNPEVPK